MKILYVVIVIIFETNNKLVGNVYDADSSGEKTGEPRSTIDFQGLNLYEAIDYVRKSFKIKPFEIIKIEILF
jgi:hypothetical protein